MSLVHRLLTYLCRNRPARYINPNSDPGRHYLVRIQLMHLPRFFNTLVCLHHYLGSDGEPNVHHHPNNGVSIVLRGAYWEDVLDRFDWPCLIWHRRQVTWFNWIGAQKFHRVVETLPNTWTLFITFGKKRGWGYLHPDYSDRDTPGSMTLVYANRHGNVGNRKWWETAPTYARMMQAITTGDDPRDIRAMRTAPKMHTVQLSSLTFLVPDDVQ